MAAVVEAQRTYLITDAVLGGTGQGGELVGDVHDVVRAALAGGLWPAFPFA